VKLASRSAPKDDIAVCEGVPAAVAVLSETGSVQCATSVFLDRFDVHDGSLASCPQEVALIAAGQADHLTALLNGDEVDLVAVLDANDRRMVVLTLPTARDGAGAEPVSPLLAEPLDESPAIVWLKDLDGRYLRVNQRYVEQLGTDAEAVRGRTDAELTARWSIEGMRLEDKDIAGQEPLELEYSIGAFEERPAFVALRFAMRDGDGQPTATCSVAAPVAEASLARAECDRLMRIDRWGRLDALAIRQELLDQWGFTLADGSSGPPLDRDDRVAAALAERDEAFAAAARMEEELLHVREQQSSLRAESEHAAQRAQELEHAVQRAEELEQAAQRVEELEQTAQRVEELEQAAQRTQELDDAFASEQARSGELEQSLARAETHAGELEAELTAIRAELEEHALSAETPDTGVSTQEGNGLQWSASSQRALSAALVSPTEWRSALNDAIATLGSEGGWDVTIAWCNDKPRGSMRCGAMWMRDPAGQRSFETRVWQHVEDAAGAEFGRARNRMATTCLLDLDSAEDSLLRDAAAEGMGSALLVPISDGNETFAMLELLSQTATAPHPDLMVSLEAIALQLGAIAQLLRLTDAPRWRTGRV
jgi:PAS domain-containing protein